jgi:transposase
MKRETFRAYIEQFVVPILKRNHIVAIDNLHNVAGIEEMINAVGATLRYLPKYSPDLNAIELPYSKFKATCASLPHAPSPASTAPSARQGLSLTSGRTDQNSRRARCRVAISFAGSAAMPPQGRVEAFDQTLSVEGFGQETNCSGFPRSCSDGFFGECCDENERHRVPLREQSFLQVDTAHGRHLDIRNHT